MSDNFCTSGPISMGCAGSNEDRRIAPFICPTYANEETSLSTLTSSANSCADINFCAGSNFTAPYCMSEFYGMTRSSSQYMTGTHADGHGVCFFIAQDRQITYFIPTCSYQRTGCAVGYLEEHCLEEYNMHVRKLYTSSDHCMFNHACATTDASCHGAYGLVDFAKDSNKQVYGLFTNHSIGTTGHSLITCGPGCVTICYCDVGGALTLDCNNSSLHTGGYCGMAYIAKLNHATFDIDSILMCVCYCCGDMRTFDFGPNDDIYFTLSNGAEVYPSAAICATGNSPYLWKLCCTGINSTNVQCATSVNTTRWDLHANATGYPNAFLTCGAPTETKLKFGPDGAIFMQWDISYLGAYQQGMYCICSSNFACAPVKIDNQTCVGIHQTAIMSRQPLGCNSATASFQFITGSDGNINSCILRYQPRHTMGSFVLWMYENNISQRNLCDSDQLAGGQPQYLGMCGMTPAGHPKGVAYNDCLHSNPSVLYAARFSGYYEMYCTCGDYHNFNPACCSVLCTMSSGACLGQQYLWNAVGLHCSWLQDVYTIMGRPNRALLL
jgi:hypothetical protein